ncbi:MULTISPECIES: hypothetical protein [unclassified Shinella]|uniref:hypothetical protein n=1 Tax=unclassified Shinella TaxID=2643062 RepID=UPI00225C9356|nr:conserved hypothetical protein [Rhizobiaceae bacterium]CAK7259111.1 conserved protein of unknown function [Shinella sp. WSC3-e]
METLWTFKTARFTVKWQIEIDAGYRYDGDDEDGSIQAALDCGDMVAFDSKMSVWLDGVEIAADYLGGSVYYADQIETFRDHIGMNAKGHGSYFSDMVRTVVAEARATLCNAPRIRCAA